MKAAVDKAWKSERWESCSQSQTGDGDVPRLEHASLRDRKMCVI